MYPRRELLRGLLAATTAGSLGAYFKSAKAGEPKSAPFNMKVGRVGTCVADLDSSIKFYSALGFDKGDYVKDENLSDLLELKNVTAYISHRPNGNTELELVQIGDARDPGVPALRPINQQGISHMVLRVDDVDRIAGVIAASGGRVISETRSTALGQPAIFCTDPDGARLLLVSSGTISGGPQMGTLNGPCMFSHYGICVADLELSGRFYREFGFDVGEIIDRGAAFGVLGQLHDVALRTRLITSGAYTFELMQWGAARNPGVPARRSLSQQGFTHIGTSGNNIEAQIGHFVSIGGTVVEAAAYRPKGSNLKVIFCTDPDGVRIELVGPMKS